MSIQVTISDADTSEVLENFRVVCLEGENIATANRIAEAISLRHDTDLDEDIDDA